MLGHYSIGSVAIGTVNALVPSFWFRFDFALYPVAGGLDHVTAIPGISFSFTLSEVGGAVTRRWNETAAVTAVWIKDTAV